MQSRVFPLLRLPLLCFALFCIAWCQTPVDVHSLPKPTGYVSDLAHVLSPEDKDRLEQFCGSAERQIGVQFALVTIDSVHGEPIQDFAIRLARAWGVGDKQTNQGVLMLLAINDHQSDVETGRGIEPYLGDGVSGSILRSIRPDLRNGDYGAAFLSAARAMATQIAQAKGVPFTPGDAANQRPAPTRHSEGSGIPGWVILAVIFFILWLLGRGGRRGGRGGYGGGGGFWPGYWAGTILSNRPRGQDWGGGGWGSSGGFGGGSGGGGGFGGFGGGDFGGGGASSNW